MGAQAIAGEDPGEEVRAVLDEIRHLVRALRLSHLDARRRVGLSAAQLFVLQSLRGENGLSLGDLAKRTSTDQSSVSVVVTRLVEKGFVDRTRSAADRRRLVLGLTPRGKALLRKAPARLAQEGLVEALEGLSSAERATLGFLLGKLVSSMGGGEGVPGMFFEKPPRARERRD